MMKPLGSTSQDKILYLLKTKGPRTATWLAKRLKLTPMAVRQHLDALLAEELVEFEDRRGKVGRPARHWRLADAGNLRFPDSHADLALGIIQALRETMGPKVLDRVIAERQKSQAASYRKQLPSIKSPLDQRVAALAAIRKEEGYMAEWSRTRDGALLLIENHCPICSAAEACQGLCNSELDLFKSVLGKDVKIERVEHIVSGDRRCVYRVEPPSQK